MSHDYWAELPELKRHWVELPELKQCRFWSERDEFTRQVKSDVGKDGAKKDAQRLDLPGYSGSEDFRQDLPGGTTPPLPFALSISLEWTLTTPFFSRSDSKFDVFDNPLCRDRLTGRPVLRASGAKGMLGHAGRMLDSIDEALWTQLMGKANESDSGGEAGRLVTGDVLFEGTPVADVFSPHDREWGVVRHPVTFETVPAGAKAEWGLMLFQYTPGEYDFAAAAAALLETAAFLIEDLGMSAKRTVGYGMGEGINVTLRAGSRLVLPPEDRREKTIRSFPKQEPEKLPPGPEKPKWGDAYLNKDGSLCGESEVSERRARAICMESGQNNEKKYQEELKRQTKKSAARRALDEWKEMKAWLAAQDAQQIEAREEKAAAHAQWEREKAAWDADPANLDVFWEYGTISAAITAARALQVKGEEK